MSAELLRAARAYIERLDLHLVVAWAGTKVPNTRFFPHGATSATQDLDLIERALHSTPQAVLSARVGEHLVIDADVRSGAVEGLAKACAGFGAFPRTWTAETPTGGVHVWFRPVDFFVRGHVLGTVELLRGNRLITLSPSRRAGGRYRWTRHPLETELAEAPAWLQSLARQPAAPERQTESVEDPDVRERRARAYMTKYDIAVAGQQGARRTMAAAVIVLRGFDLDAERAFSVLSAWNSMCDPPWSDHELRRKIRDAGRVGRMEWGQMLRQERAA
jgi:hypothetical protein